MVGGVGEKKENFQYSFSQKVLIVSYFSTEIYVVGIH